MIFVNTKYTTNSLGEGRIVATGKGKQKTMPYNHAESVSRNHGLAAGMLLELITTDEQRAKLAHPSGGQRFRVIDSDSGKMRFSIDV